MIKLKDILKESYVWERKFGEPLPTLADVQKKKNEEKLTERRAQQARNWLDAVKLSRKGAGKKLQYKDKNRNPIYGNSMFYFQGVLYQVYPDDDVQGYVAYNKKRNKVRRLSNFFTSDWKKIEIATG